MYAGEVVERGDVRAVFKNAQHPYTRKLLECDPARIARRTRALPTIPGEIPDLVNLPAGCVFAERCPDAFDRCRVRRPPAHDLGRGHSAACHLIDATVEA